jgi:hypothetical protein
MKPSRCDREINYHANFLRGAEVAIPEAANAWNETASFPS